MRNNLAAGLSALFIALGGITVAAPGAAAESEHTKGQILVKFRDDRAAADVLKQHGLSDGPAVGSTAAHLIKVPSGKELQLVDALSRDSMVEYAEPDHVATATTADQYFPRQYALQNDGQSFTNTNGDITIAAGKEDADVDAVEAWSVTTGSGIKVAVIDSGVATDNPDITPKVIARANFSTAPTSEDHYGHGTHVAGIIAAAADNTIGVAGVCPGCTILSGKVLNDNGVGSASSVVSGINWAVFSGAKVINMSIGAPASRTLETAINNAWRRGVVLVAAAGNGNSEAKNYPAAYPNVIAVAATDNTDARAPFSTFGADWVDIAAPGVDVYATFPNHAFVLGVQNNRSQGYDVASGTSMSSPIVAATAALVWSSDPDASPGSVRARVESTADSVAGTGTYWANGRVNANNAVR
ncbi:S8 family serine peptidase [Pseudarthrobacter sp. NPDC058329]|uniref:S8 family serine peptidase n=1 Tax=Pseudarthrobacter sp. NPDC058329 TaxID=3346448 RepID=UPI0036DBD0D0